MPPAPDLPLPAPIEPALIEAWAASYLARYASSAENLRQVLQRRVRRHRAGDAAAASAADGVIEAVLARFSTAGLLDDAAYAAVRARRGLAQGWSVRHIKAGLAAKGVAAGDAAAAMAGLSDGGVDPELVAACAFARRRRFGPFRTGPVAHDRELAAFARGGFERRVAEAVLACADEAAIAALLAAAD